jgi:hypothetical protein
MPWPMPLTRCSGRRCVPQARHGQNLVKGGQFVRPRPRTVALWYISTWPATTAVPRAPVRLVAPGEGSCRRVIRARARGNSPGRSLWQSGLISVEHARAPANSSRGEPCEPCGRRRWPAARAAVRCAWRRGGGGYARTHPQVPMYQAHRVNRNCRGKFGRERRRISHSSVTHEMLGHRVVLRTGGARIPRCRRQLRCAVSNRGCGAAAATTAAGGATWFGSERRDPDCILRQRRCTALCGGSNVTANLLGR